MSECLAQYETLRRKALEPSSQEVPNPKSIEAALIERQGLAAWAECGPESAVLPGERTTEQPKAESSPRELVMVLAQFVIGDREEVENG